MIDPVSTRTENRAVRHRRMIAEMSNARTFGFVAVAFVIHVVLIFGTSISYIRTHWLGAKPAETASLDSSAAASAAPSPNASPAVASPAPSSPALSPAPLAGISDDDKRMAERSNTPIVKSVTDAAKPSELPKGPTANPLDLNEKP